MKAWNGKTMIELTKCSFADRVVYKGLILCKVGRKTKNGRMLKPLDVKLPEFYVEGSEFVDRNYWLNLAAGR